MRLSYFVVVALSLGLGACAHEAENTGMQNSSSVIMMPATYAFENTSPPPSEMPSPVAQGRISRFERHVIVPGGPDGEMTPCAKNFDAIMDNLEGLMAPQIEENNRIAQQQAAIPGYRW